MEEILESPYIDKEVRENHIPEVYLGLADAYYKRASIEAEGNGQKDLRQAILYYEQYLIFANSSQNILFRNRIGDIYRTLGEYNRAASEYEEIINDYPDDVSAYISMSTMLLMDVKDVDGAVKYYDKAKNLRDAKTNSNFISLRNKLENLGVI